MTAQPSNTGMNPSANSGNSSDRSPQASAGPGVQAPEATPDSPQSAPSPSAPSKTEAPAKAFRLPKPDRENITVLLHNLPKDPVLPWNHYDSPWEGQEAPTDEADLPEGLSEDSPEGLPEDLPEGLPEDPQPEVRQSLEDSPEATDLQGVPEAAALVETAVQAQAAEQAQAEARINAQALTPTDVAERATVERATVESPTVESPTLEQVTVEPVGAQDCLNSAPADLGPDLTPHFADAGLDSASNPGPDLAASPTGNPDPALSAPIEGDLEVKGDLGLPIESPRSEEVAGLVAAIEGENAPELAQGQPLTQVAVNPPTDIEPSAKISPELPEEVILPESRNPSPDLARLLATIAPEALVNDPIEATAAADSGDRSDPLSSLPTSAPSTATSSTSTPDPTPDSSPDSQDDNLLAQLG
ncbi:MAG: hypothetical protein ACO331_09585 [Prochlorothrix sp.]